MLQRFLFALLFLVLATPCFAANGYQNTLTWWNEVARNASQYSLPLQNLYAEVEAQVGQDKSRLTQAFAKRLAQQYPGSSFHGPIGTLALNGYTQLTFDSAWNIVLLRQQLGSLTKSYDFRDQSVEVANGPNRVKFKLYPQQPQLSAFTVVDIPAISATAHQIWAKKGIRQGLFQPSKEILNEVYASRIVMTDGTRMDQLAEAMVQDDAVRLQILGMADELYSRRSSKSPAAARQLPPDPAPQREQPVQATRQALAPPNLFKAFPWFFWPALLLVGSLRVLTTLNRRTEGKRSGRGWGRDYARKQSPPSTQYPAGAVDDFSMGGDPDDAEEFSLTQPKRMTPPPTPKEWTLSALQTLEWKRFETVCAEYLRMLEFAPKETSIGPDGGIDIWVYKPGNDKPVGIVQCKAWRSYKVGVKPVRELFGVMAAEGVSHGKFITTGEFTQAAIDFAQGKKLELISGERLVAAVRGLPLDKQSALLELAFQGDYWTPTCPQCGVKMTVRHGHGQWKDFWGCSKYPRCKAKLVYQSDAI